MLFYVVFSRCWIDLFKSEGIVWGIFAKLFLG